MQATAAGRYQQPNKKQKTGVGDVDHRADVQLITPWGAEYCAGENSRSLAQGDNRTIQLQKDHSIGDGAKADKAKVIKNGACKLATGGFKDEPKEVPKWVFPLHLGRDDKEVFLS